MVSIYLSLRFQIHKDSLRESVIFKREDFNLPVTWRVPIYLKDDFSLPAKREDFNLPVTWRVPIYLKHDFSLPAKREDFNLPVIWRVPIYLKDDFSLPAKREDFNEIDEKSSIGIVSLTLLKPHDFPKSTR